MVARLAGLYKIGLCQSNRPRRFAPAQSPLRTGPALRRVTELDVKGSVAMIRRVRLGLAVAVVSLASACGSDTNYTRWDGQWPIEYDEHGPITYEPVVTGGSHGGPYLVASNVQEFYVGDGLKKDPINTYLLIGAAVTAVGLYYGFFADSGATEAAVETMEAVTGPAFVLPDPPPVGLGGAQ